MAWTIGARFRLTCCLPSNKGSGRGSSLQIYLEVPTGRIRATPFKMRFCRYVTYSLNANQPAFYWLPMSVQIADGSASWSSGTCWVSICRVSRVVLRRRPLAHCSCWRFLSLMTILLHQITIKVRFDAPSLAASPFCCSSRPITAIFSPNSRTHPTNQMAHQLTTCHSTLFAAGLFFPCLFY